MITSFMGTGIFLVTISVSLYNSFHMYTNYIKMALRNFIRDKVLTIINILGLSLGICACITIFQIISHQFGFDNFHADKERIYRIMGDLTENGGDKLHFAKIPLAVTKYAQSGIVGLDFVADVIPYDAKIQISNKGFSVPSGFLLALGLISGEILFHSPNKVFLIWFSILVCFSTL
jgi:hypothetical protein